MTKSICALAHMPGSSREAFQHYYEAIHAPLATSLFHFSAYARNHLVGDTDFGWDTISEFWSDDIEQAAALMVGPIGATMRADEERFMDRTKIASAGAEEIILSKGARADPKGRRMALLASPTVGSSEARAEVLTIAGALAHDHAGVSVDFTTVWGSLAFPAVAVIWLPGWHMAVDASTGLRIRALRVVRAETPRVSLHGAV